MTPIQVHNADAFRQVGIGYVFDTGTMKLHLASCPQWSNPPIGQLIHGPIFSACQRWLTKAHGRRWSYCRDCYDALVTKLAKAGDAAKERHSGVRAPSRRVPEIDTPRYIEAMRHPKPGSALGGSVQ